MTIMNALADQARGQFADCYTLTVERNREQLFIGDIDNVTCEQALAIYERNKQIMIDTEPTGTTITLISINGTIAEYTN